MKKLSALLALLISPAAYAADEGIARPWQLGFQHPATSVMEKLYHMHHFLLVVITLITLFVLALLTYICLRYNRRANPVANKTAHNTRLEIIWTVIPILILVVIAIPSLRIHYFMQRVVNPDLTIKVTGYQWYWHYDYPDQGGFGFDSYIKKDHLLPTEHRMLAVDNHLVVPVNATVRVLTTGADVIHSWAVPAFGVKRDAIPGRLNETWFKAEKIGTYYGQCSELCGVGHGFMPIVVDVVSQEDFANWVKGKRTQVAPAAPNAPAPVAPAAPPASAQQAKPQNLSVTPNAAPVQKQEKSRAQKTGQGKPSKSVPAVPSESMRKKDAPRPENHQPENE